MKLPEFLTNFSNQLFKEIGLLFSTDVLFEQVGIFLDKGSIIDRDLQYFYFYLLLKTRMLTIDNNKTDIHVVRKIWLTLTDAWVNYKGHQIDVKFHIDLSESTYTLAAAEVEALSAGETLPLRNGWQPEKN
ncbi:MAG: hypothetical protein AB2693_27400 [Candidatus Thiodiazotropha sp.]